MHKRECDVHTRSRPGGICCFVPATIIPIGPCTKYEHTTKSPKRTSEPTCRICVVCRYICEVQRDLNYCERLRRYGCRSQHAGGYLSSGIEVKNLCVDLVELQRQVIRPSVDLDISESRECEICGKAWELGRNGGIERSSGCYERSVGVEFEPGHSRNRENEDDSNTDRIVSSRSATNYPSKAKVRTRNKGRRGTKRWTSWWNISHRYLVHRASILSTFEHGLHVWPLSCPCLSNPAIRKLSIRGLRLGRWPSLQVQRR